MRRMERAVTLLPHPLSPTMPTVCPGSTSNEMPSTARTLPSSSSKRTRRSRTAITGAAFEASLRSGMRISRVTQSVAEEIERKYGDRGRHGRQEHPWVERDALYALSGAQEHTE